MLISPNTYLYRSEYVSYISCVEVTRKYIIHTPTDWKRIRRICELLKNIYIITNYMHNENSWALWFTKYKIIFIIKLNNANNKPTFLFRVCKFTAYFLFDSKINNNTVDMTATKLQHVLFVAVDAFVILYIRGRI